MRVLTENFHDQPHQYSLIEEHRYKEENQKQEEDALRNAVITKRKGLKEFFLIANI